MQHSKSSRVSAPFYMPAATPARARVIKEARTWIGAPFVHHQRVKAGCDCVGMIWGIGEAERVLVVDTAIAAPFVGYERTPTLRWIIKACDTFLTRVPFTYRQVADVVCFDFGRGPQHLGLLTEEGSIIHADGAITVELVVETDIPPEFRPYPAAWQYPFIDAVGLRHEVVRSWQD